MTYGSFSCDYKPKKEEKERTRLTAGGDQINYPGDTRTPTTDMTLFKIILNSVISTKGAKCMMIDLKDFYLNTPMKRPEYMRLKMNDTPEEIIKQYKLREIATSEGYVCTEITKGMYGLPQALTGRTPRQEVWLLPEQNNSRTLDSCHKTHPVQSRRR